MKLKVFYREKNNVKVQKHPEIVIYDLILRYFHFKSFKEKLVHVIYRFSVNHLRHSKERVYRNEMNYLPFFSKLV